MTTGTELFQQGSTIDFDVWPSQVLGASFKSMKVEAILDFETTRFFKLDPASMHAMVYPTLPTGTPNDFRAYSYLKLRHPNGDIQCLGVPWIKADTVVAKTTQEITAVIRNAKVGDLEQVRLALVAAGFAPEMSIK